MGSTNHGTQSISVAYYEEATSLEANRRNLDIVPRGIYSGGHLTKVSNTEVTLSPLTAELGDDTSQISVKTSTSATLNSTTLDSGDIDQSTPYLVLRWAYVASPNNYMEVHAIASVSAAQDNDIIIGKCVFSGATLSSFDYTDRTFLNIQNLFLKVIEDSGLYVWIRNGRIYTESGYITIPEQRVGPFSVPNSPNSRIDLVYVDTDGTVTVQQGTAAVSPSAPSYSNKLVVAEVTLVNGDTSIPASRIQDVRSFISGYTSQITQNGWNYSGATIHSGNVSTSWTEKDLTSIIGSGRSMMLLYASAGASANRVLLVKPSNEADASYDSNLQLFGCNKVGDQGLVMVHANNGKIKVKDSFITTSWTIKLIGWQNFVG